MAWNSYTNISDAAKWLRRKVELIEEKQLLVSKNNRKSICLQIYRGGIFDCELGLDNIGCEKNKTRPVLVLSNNCLNKGHTVVIVPLSTKFERKMDSGMAKYNNHYLLKKEDYPFLDTDSVVKFEDIRSVDVIRLRSLRGNIQKSDMDRMKRNLIFTCGY